jgi:hypothetical protein
MDGYWISGIFKSLTQVIEYMKNPVPANQLANQPYMQCKYQPTPNICNGASNVGINSCSLSSGLFQVGVSKLL